MALLEKVVIQVKGDSKKLDPTIAKLQKLGKIDKDNAKSFKKSSKEFQSSAKKSGSIMDGLGKKALVLGTALIGAFAIKQVVGNAIKIIKDFEKEMSTLQSITGSTTKEMEFFAKAAFDIGRATKTAGTEVVKAFTIIGSAQPELLKNQKALAGVTKQALILAKAAGIDTVQAAEALTSAMNQFGASADDAAKFTDIFATSQQKGSSFIIDTSEALKLVGASADAVGLSFETTNAAIQALAKGALRGSMAGTSLNAVLAQLSKQNDEKINPSIVGLSKALAELERRNLSFKDATELVQIEGAKGLLTLIKQRDIFEELNGNLNDTGNAMEQMRINTDNLNSSLEEFGNAFEELSVKAGENAGILKKTTDFATSLLQAFSGTGAEAFRLGKAFGFTNFELAILRKEMGTWADVVIFLDTQLDRLGLEVEEFGATIKPNVEGAISVSEALDKWRLAAKGLTEETEEGKEETEEAVKTVKQWMEKLSQLRTELKDTIPKSEAYRNKLVQIKVIQDLLRVSTEKALSPLKLLQKRITDLKSELEEQALATGLSEKTLIEYTRAIKRAEEANKLLTDAIADQNIELIKLIDPLQQGIDAEVEGLEMVGAAQLESFEKEKIRIEIIKDKREVAINGAIELERQLFAILSNINEGKLIQIENERKAAIQAIEDKRAAGTLSEDRFLREKGQLNKKFDDERARILTKQAKNDQAAAIIAAIINTAVAVTATLEIPVLAALIAVAGAAEIATIAAQPIPEFHRGKRGEYSDEEINAKVLRSEYVIPPKQSRKHSAELDAMLNDKFERFVFMKYQMPIIKQYSNMEQAAFSDSAITRHQRKHTDLLITNNQLLRQIIPSIKRASYGWN